VLLRSCQQYSLTGLVGTTHFRRLSGYEDVFREGVARTVILQQRLYSFVESAKSADKHAKAHAGHVRCVGERVRSVSSSQSGLSCPEKMWSLKV
jgi:hypothetical protein